MSTATVEHFASLARRRARARRQEHLASGPDGERPGRRREHHTRSVTGSGRGGDEPDHGAARGDTRLTRDDVVTVVGPADGLHASDAPLDCGNSGTTMRLLSGVVSAVPGRAPLDRRRVTLPASDGPGRRAVVVDGISNHGSRTRVCAHRCTSSARNALRGIDYRRADGQRAGEVGHPLRRARRHLTDDRRRARANPAHDRRDALPRRRLAS